MGAQPHREGSARGQKKSVPLPAHCRLDFPAMSRPGFIEAGLAAMRDALEIAAERAGLILQRYELTRAAARAFRARVRELETLLRRLLVLMAAEIEVRATDTPRLLAEAGPPCHSTPHQDTPGAGEACWPADPRQNRRPGGYRFVLLPVLTFDLDAPDRFAGLVRTAPKPPDRTPLMHRYATLRALLSNPAPLARRMARHLARLKAAGEPKPVCLPQPGLHRFEAALATFALALPLEIAEALGGWYDSG